MNIGIISPLVYGDLSAHDRHYLPSDLVLAECCPLLYRHNICKKLTDLLPDQTGLNWKQIAEDILTHYQTTNFRLFQIETVCRRQF